MSAPGEFSIIVPASENHTRLDAFLAVHVTDLSRSHAAALIRTGHITVGGEPRKAGYRIKPGELISGRIPAPTPLELTATPIALDVLYEDDVLIVINKPAGLVVHPAAGHSDDTLVNALLYHCPDLAGIGGVVRPGIVHRLDKDTTGVLVVAKNERAQEVLSLQFKERKVAKTYLAVVKGSVRANQGCIDLPVGRHPTDRKRMSTISRKGRAAVTLWRVKERLPGASLLEIDLHTGRTHQIRVHCAAIGHPVLGDPVYGRSKAVQQLANKQPACYQAFKTLTRQMLHAARLGFYHPVHGEFLAFEADLPTDMAAFLDVLRDQCKSE